MVFQLMAVIMMATQAAGVGQAREDRLRGGMQDIQRIMQHPVSLTAPLVGADGSRRGPGVTVTDAGGRFYVSTPNGSCDASISTTPPTNVRDGWRVAARVRERRSTFNATVDVEWQRMWSGGRPITNGASATTEIELRPGDRVPLDHLETSAPGLECHGRVRALELVVFGNVIHRPPTLPVMPPPGLMTMEAWLVHLTPADVETTYAIALPFDPAETRFVFRTQSITTHDGTFYADLDGAVRTVRREDGSLGLWAGFRRAIVDTSTNTTRMATGSGGSVIDWGQAGEVISFDLPAIVPVGAGRGGIGIGGGGGGSGRGAVAGGVSNAVTHSAPHLPPLMGHKFSVRIRFVPMR